MNIFKLKRYLKLISISLLLPTSTVLASDRAHTYEDDDNRAASGYSKLVRMANAMGGFKKIKSLAGQRLIANGEHHEPEQSFYPGGEFIHIANYQQVLVQSFKQRQSHTNWSVDAFYPIIAQRQFSEIINGDYAAVIGVDSVFPIPQAPMTSNRLAARYKLQLLSSPLALIHQAMQTPDKIHYLGTRSFRKQKHQVISIPVLGHKVKLFINVKSGLPSFSQTLEDDSIYGDAKWRVVYKSWHKVNGIKLPTKLVHSINKRKIHTAHLSSVELLKDIDQTLFTIPDELKADFNPQLFSWGVRSSVFFNRFSLTGIPFDLDQSSPETVNLVDIAPGVTHVLGLTHNTLIVEMDNYLVAIDPPLYEQRTENVIKAISARWPSKPIKYIVASHFHNDHIGGIRGYAAVGATLVVGEETEDHYEAILESPHTVYPDTLSKLGIENEIIEVSADEPFYISDGTRKIKIFDVANRHSIGTLVPYIEDVKMVFVSDLYNPNAFPVPLPPLFSFWSLDLRDGLENSGLDIEQLVGAHGSVVSYQRFIDDVEATF